jgi:hypothetical protein
MGPIFLINFVPGALLLISVLEVSWGKSVTRGPMDAELATETQGFKPLTPGVEMAGDALPLFLLCIKCSSLFPFSTSRHISELCGRKGPFPGEFPTAVVR